MNRLMETWAKKTDQIPMPLGGRILLTLYWWGWKLVGPGRDWDDYDDVIMALNSPLKVQAWLWANIKYTADKKPEDNWQPARVTFERRKGDCEDWAIFANKCLRNKYNGVFLCMYNKKKGHVTYLVEREKKGNTTRWTSIGTFGYKSHKGVDYDDIIPDWKDYENWVSYTIQNNRLEKIKSKVNKERSK